MATPLEKLDTLDKTFRKKNNFEIIASSTKN